MDDVIWIDYFVVQQCGMFVGLWILVDDCIWILGLFDVEVGQVVIG